MDGTADAALAAWASVRGFFTPATLFLVVNLVIGTIALTSRSRRRGNAHHDGDAHLQHHHQEPPFQQAQHQDNQYYDDHRHHEQHHQEQQYVPPPPAPAPLARTSSVLDRLRSIGLYRFRSGDFPPEYATPVGTDSRDAVVDAPAPAAGDAEYSRSRSDPAPAPPRAEIRRPSRMMKSSTSEARTAELPPAPAARVVQSAVPEEDDDVLHYTRADEFTGGNSFAPQQEPLELQHEEEEEEEEEQYYREEYVPPLRLARAPSVLERLRSFSLSRFRSGEIAADDAAAAVAELERNHAQKQQATQYSRSRSEPSREQSTKGKKQQQETAEAKMSKSSTVARKPPAPVVAAEPEAEAGGVDARADDFINSFRKQLQLQRLNSLLNYKDMLNRGA